MFKYIAVTEKNYEKILTKFQKVTSKHEMINWYKFRDNDPNPDAIITSHKTSSIGFRNEGFINGKMKKEFVVDSTFIDVTRHWFIDHPHAEYLPEIIKTKPCYVHMSTGVGMAVVLHEGDKVMFLPFGGFRVWQHETNEFLGKRDDKDYFYTYFPRFFKELNLKEARALREMHENEAAEAYYKDEIEDSSWEYDEEDEDNFDRDSIYE